MGRRHKVHDDDSQIRNRGGGNVPIVLEKGENMPSNTTRPMTPAIEEDNES